MDDVLTAANLFEQRFWLQIMGDHARFIFYSLAPNERVEIPRAQSFSAVYDELLGRARRAFGRSELDDVNSKSYKLTYEFKSYILQLLALMLSSSINSSLPPTCLSRMLNETDEYIFILNSLISGQTAAQNVNRCNLLWLPDAAVHAAVVSAKIDHLERDITGSSQMYERQFTDLYLKSLDFNGYMRTKLRNFPALERLGAQAYALTLAYREFLEHLRDARKTGGVLGTLTPLTADHMAREAGYYLIKLSQAAENIPKPDCDPTAPRVGN